MCVGPSIAHGYLAINLALILHINFQNLALQFTVDISVLRNRNAKTCCTARTKIGKSPIFGTRQVLIQVRFSDTVRRSNYIL